jgi:hypothetical protein
MTRQFPSTFAHMLRRIALQFAVLLALGFSVSAQASVLHPAVPKAISTVILPGKHTVKLDHLDPEFRADLEVLVENLEAQGYSVRVESTYRSSRRQDLLYNLTMFWQGLGFKGGFTNAPGGQSCHNMTNDKGEPASLAVDLWGYRYGPLLRFNPRAKKKHSQFLRALGAEAHSLGMNWGGDWIKIEPWDAYGLGKDPPHVSSQRCDFQ